MCGETKYIIGGPSSKNLNEVKDIFENVIILVNPILIKYVFILCIFDLFILFNFH